MARSPDDSDPAAWHRHFAMEANNRAWQLSVEARDLAKDCEMLSAAHASAQHRAAYQEAAAAVAAIADEEDRVIVLKTFRQVAAP